MVTSIGNWNHLLDSVFRSIKIDCINVSTTPVKSSIDDLLQSLFDALIISLRRSILNDYNRTETYLNEGIQSLGKVPQSIDEIGEATQKHSALAADLPQVFCFASSF